jgi:hypothetical protein
MSTLCSFVGHFFENTLYCFVTFFLIGIPCFCCVLMLSFSTSCPVGIKVRHILVQLKQCNAYNKDLFLSNKCIMYIVLELCYVAHQTLQPILTETTRIYISNWSMTGKSLSLCLHKIPIFLNGRIEYKIWYSSASVSMGNTFQDVPQLHETADNTERYI